MQLISFDNTSPRLCLQNYGNGMLLMNELEAIDRPKFKSGNLGNVRKSQNGGHGKVAASQLLSLWGFPLSGSMLCNKSVQTFQFTFKEPFRRHHSSSTKTWPLHLAMILRIDCQPAAHKVVGASFLMLTKRKLP